METKQVAVLRTLNLLSELFDVTSDILYWYGSLKRPLFMMINTELETTSSHLMLALDDQPSNQSKIPSTPLKNLIENNSLVFFGHCYELL